MKRANKVIGCIAAICTIIGTTIMIFGFVTGSDSLPDFFASSNNPSDTATITPFVTITAPENDDRVGMWEWINGTSKNIPNGQELWIVVHEGNLYYPMVDRVQRNTDGTWQYNTSIGKEADSGKTFDIIAVLADGSAQDAVEGWYASHGSYDLSSLPSGMTQYSTITVTRK